MIPQNMLPAALRTAPVEEQLSYLLQRRRTIERLMQSLETYTRERDGTPLEGQNSADSAAA
jgi:hypothetical protein